MSREFSPKCIVRAQLLASVGALSILSSPALAVNPVPAPPVRQAVDGNGVDVMSGSLNASSVELSIGPNAKDGIVFSRYWTGSGWRESVTATLSTSGGKTIVSYGGSSDAFTGTAVSGYVSATGNGATLVRPGGVGNYIYTSSDGTTIEFEPKNGQYDRFVSDLGWAIKLRHPDGTQLNFAYKGQNYCPHELDAEFPTCSQPLARSVRLRSVTNHRGYELRYFYAGNVLTHIGQLEAFNTVTQVTAYNMGSDYCGATDTCSFTNTWPTVSFSSPNYVTLPDGGIKSWTVDGLNRITGIKRPGSSSNTVSIAYDAYGRVQSVTNEGIVTTYSWSDAGGFRTLQVRDASGTLLRTVYSDIANARVINDTDALGRTVSYQYDTLGRVTRTTAPDLSYRQVTYDGRGNITEARAVAAPAIGGADIVTSAVFPATCTNPKTCNKPTSTTDARGAVTDYTYDANHGGVLTATSPAAPSGVRPQTRYTYSQMYAYYKMSTSTISASLYPVQVLTGISACQSLASCTGGADESKASIGYGPQVAGTANNLLPVSVTAASGNGTLSATTTTTYDTVGNALTVDGPLAGAADTVRTRYDARRRVVGVVSADPDGAGSLPHRAQRVTYNPDGQVTKSEVGTVAGQSDAQWTGFVPAQEVSATYDANGRKVREDVKSGGGGSTFQVTQYSYDSRGRQECTALRMNSATWGSLPGACTPATAGTAGPDRITRTSYDLASQVTSVQVAVGTADQATERALTYTSSGQVATLTDGEGNRTTYEYDGHNRLVKTRFPIGTKGANSSSTTDYEQLTLDPNGNVTLRRMRDGSTIGFTYDALDRVTVKTLPAVEGSVLYSHDLQGRLKSAYQAWDTITFNYDALGRQTSVSNFLGTTSYQYDAAGRRTRLTWPDGFYVGYDYLVTGEVTAIRENGAASGAGVLASFGYDSLGRRTSLTRGNGTTTSYAYDSASRLSQLVQDPAGTAQDLTLGFTYNPASQIATSTRSNDSYAWTAHYNVTRPYTANGLNQYTLSGSVTPTYDGRGNLTSAGGPTYGYYQENRLATISGLGALYYDPVGRLVISSAQYATRFGYDGTDMIGEYNTSNQLLRRYVHGPGADEPLVWYEGSGTSDRRWLHADERGSVIAVTNGAGATLALNSYDEYGIPGPANQGRFQYTGQAWLPEFGLYHYKARAYSPTLGRFLQTDPIGYGDGMNMYAYVGGDPVNGTDPTGLSTDTSGGPKIPMNPVGTGTNIPGMSCESCSISSYDGPQAGNTVNTPKNPSGSRTAPPTLQSNTGQIRLASNYDTNERAVIGNNGGPTLDDGAPHTLIVNALRFRFAAAFAGIAWSQSAGVSFESDLVMLSRPLSNIMSGATNSTRSGTRSFIQDYTVVGRDPSSDFNSFASSCNCSAKISGTTSFIKTQNGIVVTLYSRRSGNGSVGLSISFPNGQVRKFTYE